MVAREMAKQKQAAESQRQNQVRKPDRHRKPLHRSEYNEGLRD